MKEVTDTLNIQAMAIKDDFPYSATIEIITKCNFHCEHCYIPNHTEEMKYADVLDIIDQLYDLGVFEVVLTGGEIALHSSFMDIVRYIRKKGLSLVLMSNTSLFSEKMIKEIAELHVNSVSTTLFSMNDKINDSITKHYNSAEMVLKKVQLLRSYGINTDIKVPIMKKNWKDFRQILDFCESNNIGIDYSVTITKRTNGDEVPLIFGLCQEELNQFIDENDLKLKSIRKEYNRDDYLCKAVGMNLALDVYGNVFPCNSFPYKYGNVFENSLYDIWYNRSERQKLKQIKKKDVEKCDGCKMNTICSRCPGLAFSENGGIYEGAEWNKKLAIARSK